MIRFDFFIEEEQKIFLESLGGNISDHIRHAIQEYIDKKKKGNASISPSKKGGSNG